MNPYESYDESKFAKYVENDGGVVHKLVKQKGWPDRLVVCPKGLGILYIEFKRRGALKSSTKKLQKHIHQIIKGMGYVVFVSDSYKEAVAVYEEYKRLSTASLHSGEYKRCSIEAVSSTVSSTRSGKNTHIIDFIPDSKRTEKD